MSCNLIKFVRIFCNDSEAILSRISDLCPGGQSFLSEKHLKEFHKSYSFSKNDLKPETTLAKNLLRKDSKLPMSLEHFFHLLLLKKLRLIVTASCNFSSHQRFMREVFQK